MKKLFRFIGFVLEFIWVFSKGVAVIVIPTYLFGCLLCGMITPAGLFAILSLCAIKLFSGIADYVKKHENKHTNSLFSKDEIAFVGLICLYKILFNRSRRSY